MTRTLTSPVRTIRRYTEAISLAARQRLESSEGGATFLSDWHRVLFVHYEVPPQVLQPLVPYELDLRGGRAYISLVPFTLRRLRPRIGGKITQWLSCPFSNQRFLNVRTYVTHGGEPGIYFLAEWLSSRLSAFIGPRTFGLPCLTGALDLRHDVETGLLRGEVVGVNRATHHEDRLRYRATLAPDSPCDPSEEGSFAEFALERYTAFTARGGVMRRFRIWHEPWAVAPVDVAIDDASLLAQTGNWLPDARIIAAHYSPGVSDVWYGKPLCINGEYCSKSILPARPAGTQGKEPS